MTSRRYMILNNKTQKMLATERLSIAIISRAVGCLNSMSGKMNLKSIVLECSVFQFLIFHLTFVPWSLECICRLVKIGFT